MSKTNPITIDLRKLTNEQLKGLYDTMTSIGMDSEFYSELSARGYDSVYDLNLVGDDFFGKYPIVQEYVNSFQSPEDSRGDGGC